MCIYCIDEKFYTFYVGCKIEYVCVNNVCPHTRCSSYLRFSRIWWLNVLRSFMSSFLRPHGKSTLAVPSYLHRVRLDIFVRRKLKIFQSGVCTYDFSTKAVLHLHFLRCMLQFPCHFILPRYYYCLTKNISPMGLLGPAWCILFSVILLHFLLYMFRM